MELTAWSAYHMLVMAKRKKHGTHTWPARLARMQARLGLNNQEMADRLGISVHTWNAWRYGSRTPAGPSQAAIRLLEELTSQ